MGTLKFSLTTPKVNLKWWNSSRNELTDIIEKQNRESWGREEDPVTGAKWAPRKPPTGSWPLLRKTGLMQDTVKYSARPSRPMVFLATTTDYGPFLQYGTRFMPQRRWVGIGPNITREFERVLAKYMFKGKTTISFMYKW